VIIIYRSKQKPPRIWKYKIWKNGELIEVREVNKEYNDYTVRKMCKEYGISEDEIMDV